jgi:tetratricopeptide (TPR) repeat protein
VLTMSASVARVWDADTGASIGLSMKARNWSRPPAFSSDGRLLLTGVGGVWDTATGVPITPPRTGPGPFSFFTMAMSLDGRHIISRGDDWGAWLWNLVPDERPVQDLTQLAQFLTGQRIDANGELNWIPRGEGAGPSLRMAGQPIDANGELSWIPSKSGHVLEKPWEALRQKYPDTFRPTATEETAWRWQEVLEAEARGGLGIQARGARQIGHLDALIKTEPPNSRLYHLRAGCLGALDREAEAVPDLLRAVGLGWDDRHAASTLEGMGTQLWATDRLHEAEQACGAAVSLYEKEMASLPGGSPERATVRRALVKSNFCLALALTGQGRSADAINAYRRSLELDPDKLDPDTTWARICLARVLSLCADLKQRKPAEALALAKEAVKKMEGEPHAWSTLGIALYRGQEWQASIAALDRAIALRKRGEAIEWFVLAMAYWQLGEKAKARQWYDRAVGWMTVVEPFLRHSESVAGVLAAAPGGPLGVLPALQLKSKPPRANIGEEELRVIRSEAAGLLDRPAPRKKP